jgi:hypothetical protein
VDQSSLLQPVPILLFFPEPFFLSITRSV